MKSKVAIALMAVLTVALGINAGALAASRARKVALLCNIKTIQHLNCGGGLRAPNSPPPDCTNFVSESVTGSRTEKISAPSNRFYLRNGKIEVDGPIFISPDVVLSDEGKISYESQRNLYSDAAGYSVDRGLCTIVSGNALIQGASKR
jgi:hypothetical protein